MRSKVHGADGGNYAERKKSTNHVDSLYLLSVSLLCRAVFLFISPQLFFSDNIVFAGSVACRFCCRIVVSGRESPGRDGNRAGEDLSRGYPASVTTAAESVMVDGAGSGMDDPV